MKRCVLATLISLCIILSACSKECEHDFTWYSSNELSQSGLPQYHLICKDCGYETYKEINNENNAPKDDTPQHIKEIFNRFLEWQEKHPSENIRIHGPLELDGSFWTFDVDILNSLTGNSKHIHFYVPEDESAEHSFYTYFEEDEKAELRDCVNAVVYAASSGMSDEECLSISNSLINSYSDGISAICDLGQYKIFIAEQNTVFKYRIQAIYKEEQHQKIDKSQFKEVDYDRLVKGKSELSNEAILFKFSGTVSEYSISYPYSTIVATDSSGNHYTISASYDNTLDDIVEGTQYVFYASLGENSGAPVRCGLHYFEMSE